MSQDKNDFLRALMGNPLSGLTGVTPPPNAWSARSLLTATTNPSRDRWGARFETWARPLSQTEEQKCQNAENMIRNALDGHKELDGLNIRVFAQGSYRSNTNVRADSDVDICVRCSNTFFHDTLPAGVANNFSPATLNYSTYRSKIGAALYDAFTFYGVKAGNKAFSVTENTYRITADVVPTFEYRKYFWLGSELKYISGVCFFSNDGKFIVNWPEQTYENGVAKNERTSRRYKRVVRVLKGLRNELEEKGFSSAKKISSFQIACLAYNVMDGFYNSTDLYENVKAVANQIWYHGHDSSKSAGWTEVDEIKPLFPSDQAGKAKEVADFFWDLMKYVEFQD